MEVVKVNITICDKIKEVLLSPDFEYNDKPTSNINIRYSIKKFENYDYLGFNVIKVTVLFNSDNVGYIVSYELLTEPQYEECKTNVVK